MLAVVTGAPLAAGGLFLLGGYVVGVVDILIHRPADRSWIFWGLGLAFIGASLLVGGAALLVFAWKTRSRG